MAAAAERDLARDPPTAVGPRRLAGRVKCAGHGRYSAGIEFSDALGRQPRRIGGDGLVHDQVPRRGGVDARNRFPYPNAIGRVQLEPAIGFRGEHREQTGIVHGLIDRVRKAPIRLGGSGVFGDQRADALDLAEQITDGLICHYRSFPVLISSPRGIRFATNGAPGRINQPQAHDQAPIVIRSDDDGLPAAKFRRV